MTDCQFPLYCGGCNEVHHFTWPQIERIVYALQGELIDATISNDRWLALHDAPGADEPDCLNLVLSTSRDGEGYGEHTDSYVESRMVMEPVPCPLHDVDEGAHGPHHHPLCHYFDPDEPWPDGVDPSDNGSRQAPHLHTETND